MSFDEIFDLTAGVYVNFYNIYVGYLRVSATFGVPQSGSQYSSTAGLAINPVQFTPSKCRHSREKGNRVVNCSSSGHALRRAQKPYKKKCVIEKLQPQDERAGARARDERCQSPSSLTAENAGVGGILWVFPTG